MPDQSLRYQRSDHSGVHGSKGEPTSEEEDVRLLRAPIPVVGHVADLPQGGGGGRAARAAGATRVVQGERGDQERRERHRAEHGR